jgi:hypothetical protein
MTNYQVSKLQEALYNVIGNRAYRLPTYVLESIEIAVTCAPDESQLVKLNVDTTLVVPNVFKVLSSGSDTKASCGHEIAYGQPYYISDAEGKCLDLCENCGILNGLTKLSVWVEEDDLRNFWFKHLPLLKIVDIKHKVIKPTRTRVKGVDGVWLKAEQSRKRQERELKREKMLESAVEC